MTHGYGEIIQFRGNHYDFGVMQGDLLKGSSILPNRKKQSGSKSRLCRVYTKDLKVNQVLLQFAPRICDELYGLADSLKTINMMTNHLYDFLFISIPFFN